MDTTRATRPISSRTRRFLVILGAVCLVAFLVRVGVSLQLRSHPSVLTPLDTTDMETYRALAHGILRGQWPESFYYQPFYYAVFLPVVFGLLGAGFWGLTLVQALLGAASAGLAGLTAARLFGRRAGLAAAGLTALARFHVFYTPFSLIAVLQGFWMALLLWAGMRALIQRRAASWGLAGVVLACAALTRGNVILYVPLLLVLLVWREHSRPRRCALVTAVFLACVVLPQLPFAWHNHRALGGWTGPSSAAGAVLALSNTPEAPPGGLEYSDTYHEWRRTAKLPEPHRISVARQMVAWIAEEPLTFVELKLRTALLFWHNAEIGNNISFEREGRSASLLRWPIFLDFGLLAVVGLTGMAFAIPHLRTSRRCAWAWCAVLWYAGATVAFYVLARFRLPVVPLLAVFGGYAFHLATDRRHTAPTRPLRLGAVAAAAAVLVYGGFPLYRNSLEPVLQRWLRPHGVCVQREGRIILRDNGPIMPDGWAGVPCAGTAVRKTFDLRTVPAERRGAPARLRVALLANTPEVAYRVRCGETVLQSRSAASPRTSLTHQELSIPLRGIDCNRDEITFTVEVRAPVPEAFLLVDAHRDYGRTRIRVGEEELPTPGEAAMALEFEAEPAH